MEQVYSYALTTLQRCKDRIFDAAQLSFTGDTTASSTDVANVTVPSGLTVGQSITGSGIPYGTTVAAIGSNSITLSQNATATASGVALTVANQPVNTDSLIIRLINAVTDAIERECGKSGLEFGSNAGHFMSQTYTNEVYTVDGNRQKNLVLRNAPLFYRVVTGDLTAGSAVVNNVSPSTGITAGMVLFAAQGLFPAFTKVLSVSGSTVTMSQPASVTQTGAVFEISGLTSFQWRAGTPSYPSWTDFFADQYEVVNQGASGIIRVYGVMPKPWANMLRATYVAGYLIDWANAGNGSTHTLPSDLTATCENIVVRLYKRRQLAGQSSESSQGATVSGWRNVLDIEDQMTLARYTRVSRVM